MACSGSVSLELMYRTRPAVILYWVNAFSYMLAKYFLLRVQYMTLVNLLACEDRFERAARHHIDPKAPRRSGAGTVSRISYLPKTNRQQLANHVIQWLQDPAAHHFRVTQLAELKSRFCATGATRAAADHILNVLSTTPTERQADRRVQAA